MNRTILRSELRRKRKQITPAKQREYAVRIGQQLFKLAPFLSSENLAGYYAHQSEVNPASILEHARELKKTTYLPILHDKHKSLLFAQCRLGDSLTINHYGIPEPKNTHLLAAEELDVVLVPLLGFDATGNRLGSGQGYYDHTFAFLKDRALQKPILIGLAYACQQLPNIIPETWDIPLDFVITEEKIYDCHSTL